MTYLLKGLGLAVLTPLLTQIALAEPLSAVPAQPLPRAQVTPAAAGESLCTQEGTDPPFESLLKQGVIKPGESFSKGPVFGSRIHVNQALLEKQVGKIGPIPQDIGLHTEVCGDSIRRKDFPKWTRWYQEDHHVQIFRLFKGEQNIRGGIGEKGSRGRVEVFAKPITLAPGTWGEWEGTYTVVKPIAGCIFQLMHEGSLWSFHIDMTAEGEIHFLRRRPVPGMEREISLAENMVGKSLSIKVRANGKDYEIYKKASLDKGPWTLVTRGSFNRAENNKIQFRWGIYAGSRKGGVIPDDGMLFVTGVTIK